MRRIFEDIKIEIKNNVLILNVKEYPFISQLILLEKKVKNIPHN